MIRLLLIWLLALALPMQGALAAAVVFCGPNHHRAAEAAAAAPSEAAQSGRAHGLAHAAPPHATGSDSQAAPSGLPKDIQLNYFLDKNGLIKRVTMFNIGNAASFDFSDYDTTITINPPA